MKSIEHAPQSERTEMPVDGRDTGAGVRLTHKDLTGG